MFKEQERAICRGHKAEYIEAAHIIEVTKVEEPAIEAYLPEVEGVREAASTIGVIEDESGVEA